MAAVDQSGICELMLHFPRAIYGAGIQQLLYAPPTFVCHQRFVRAGICHPVPIEVATVYPFPQDLVDNAALQSVTAQLHTF
jgi:hypothetical protein